MASKHILFRVLGFTLTCLFMAVTACTTAPTAKRFVASEDPLADLQHEVMLAGLLPRSLKDWNIPKKEDKVIEFLRCSVDVYTFVLKNSDKFAPEVVRRFAEAIPKTEVQIAEGRSSDGSNPIVPNGAHALIVHGFDFYARDKKSQKVVLFHGYLALQGLDQDHKEELKLEQLLE